MKSVEHRKLIYAFVEKALGRELTPEEHEDLKKLLTTMNKEATDAAVQALAASSKKVKPLGRALYIALHKKGFELTDIQFLKDALELTDADVAPKEKKPKEDNA